MSQIEQADSLLADKVKQIRDERRVHFVKIPTDLKYDVQRIAQLSTELGELHATRHLLAYTSVDIG